jgi:hypothetical protein
MFETIGTKSATSERDGLKAKGSSWAMPDPVGTRLTARVFFVVSMKFCKFTRSWYSIRQGVAASAWSAPCCFLAPHRPDVFTGVMHGLV